MHGELMGRVWRGLELLMWYHCYLKQQELKLLHTTHHQEAFEGLLRTDAAPLGTAS